MHDNNKLRPAELAVLCSEYAMILSSGIPLYDGAAILQDSDGYSRSRTPYEQISAVMQQGGTLYEALRSTGQFPDYMLEMIRLAEQTGQLESVLGELSRYYERISRYEEALRQAVVYPVVLIVMMSVVISVLVVKVVPVFGSVYRNLGIPLTSGARAVMDAGIGLGYAVMVFAVVLCAAALALLFAWKRGKEEKIMTTAARILPFMRRIRKDQAAATYASILSIALQSGYSVEEMTEEASRFMPDARSKAKAEQAGLVMRQGGSFYEAVRQTGFYEPIHERMIEVGEKTGQIGTVMEKLTGIYQKKTLGQIDQAVSNAEPVLIGILTIIAGGILLAVMIPLAGILLAMS